MIHFMQHLREAGQVQLRNGEWDLDGPQMHPGNVIPQTLKGLIAGEIDRLDALDRRLLEAASVIGATFSTAILSHVADEDRDHVEERLHQLVREGRFVEFRNSVSLNGRYVEEFAFRHHFFRGDS